MLIFESLFGSHLYGTSTPQSDIDYRGVFVPEKDYLLSPFKNIEQKEYSGEDKVHYALKKFFQLASDCNPNIVELLFTTSDTKTVNTDAWKEIEENRDLFLSQKCRFTFSGYAESQLKRIKLHRSWLLNPPKTKPNRKDYGLKDAPEFGLEKVEVLIHAPIETIDPKWREYALAEKSYHDAKQYWDNYDNWKKSRNPKRAEIEERYGYDTKHAMHLYRLLGEAKELLENRIITFPRPDKDFLLAIRNGYYKYDDLIIESESIKLTIDNIETSLCKKPNLEKLEDLYIKVIEKYI